MKSLLWIVCVGLLFSASTCVHTIEPVDAPVVHETKTQQDVINNIQKASVLIKAGYSQGTGFVIKRDGHTFIMTAGHVIDHLKKYGTDGEFYRPDVVQVIVSEGDTVGEISVKAKVIRWSDADKGDDLALLLLKDRNPFKHSVEFSDIDVPHVGMNICHVGCFHGELGSMSYSCVVISQVGRMRNEFVFDQTSATAFPGSSGGGVYDLDGNIIGMLVRGAGETFNLIVPVRRIRCWSHECNADFLFDKDIKITKEMLKYQ